MLYRSFIIILIATINTISLKAQTVTNNNLEIDLKLGVNIGGAAPLPMTQEIRKIEDYSPQLNASIEGTITRWFGTSKKWGGSIGIKLEKKGMSTGATVKNYHTDIVQGKGSISGYYTGFVKTNYNETMLTIPVLANYSISDSWKIRAGIFGSIRLYGKFDGYVSDGYLRENTPIGVKIKFENDSKADYNFSNNLSKFHCGAQLGGSWKAAKRIWVNADFTWTFSNIFKKDFKTISFNLYPIYLNLGVGYRI